MISKCHEEGCVGVTTGSGAGFFVGRSEAAAGAPQSPARTASAAQYVRIIAPPIPAIGR
jgi:hypothetical protein